MYVHVSVNTLHEYYTVCECVLSLVQYLIVTSSRMIVTCSIGSDTTMAPSVVRSTAVTSLLGPSEHTADCTGSLTHSSGLLKHVRNIYYGCLGHVLFMYSSVLARLITVYHNYLAILNSQEGMLHVYSCMLLLYSHFSIAVIILYSNI